jgi:peptidoglycan hydrolase CwlO-like protein
MTIPLFLTGCGKAKLETENSNLKQQIRDLQSENGGLTNEVEKDKQQFQLLEKQIGELEGSRQHQKGNKR